MLIVISIFEDIFIGVGLNRYLLTIPFLIPALMVRGFSPYNKYPDNILVAAHRPNQLLVLNVIFELLKILTWYLTIAVFKVHELGLAGTVYVVTLTEFPIMVFRFIVKMLYIHKTIFKLKFMAFQSLVAPIGSTSILLGVFIGLKNLLLDRLWSWSFIGTLIIGVVIILVLVLCLYFPLTILLGGWDDNSIRDLKAAVKMSGPSKVLTKPMIWFIFKVLPYSKLHNKHKFDESEAVRQIRELIQLRDINREIYTEK